MFGLKTFRRVPPVLPCNFCHPDGNPAKKRQSTNRNMHEHKQISLGNIATLKILVLFSKTEIRDCTIMFGLVSKYDIYTATEFFRPKMRNSVKQTVVKFSTNSHGECC